MIDVGTVAVVVASASGVATVYLTVRTGLRRDHRDERASRDAAVKKQIDDAIEAERVRVELQNALEENRRLKGRGHVQPE